MARVESVWCLLTVVCMIALGAGTVDAQGVAGEAENLGPFSQDRLLKVSPSILHRLSLRTGGITPKAGWAIGTAAMDINAQGLQVYIGLEEFDPTMLASRSWSCANI